MVLKIIILMFSTLMLASCERNPATHSGPFLIRDGVTYDQKTNEPVTGIIADYYDSGELAEKIALVSGIPNGVYESYFKNGALQSKVMYEVYDDGRTKRYVESYHYNGLLKEKVRFEDGKKEGLFEAFYESGQLEARRNFVNGEEQGLSEIYHSNGQLAQSVVFLDGQEDGERKSYGIDGHLTATALFKNGIKEGMSKEYYPNGSLKSKAMYLDGCVSGFSEVYFADGGVSEKWMYDSVGNAVKVKRFNESGREISESKIVRIKGYIPPNEPC